MTATDNTIVFILPSTVVCKTVRKVIARMGFSYPVYERSLDAALGQAREALAAGARMVVSNGLTFTYLEQRLKRPLMKLPFSGIEAADAVKVALMHSRKVAHMGTRELNDFLNKSLRLLGYDESLVTFRPITAERSLEEQTKEVLDAGFEVVIGGFPTVNFARKHGKVGIEFDVDEQVIEATVTNARQLVAHSMEEERKLELIDAILHSTSDGIIALDENRRVTMVNPAAEKIIRCPSGAACGKDFGSFMEENHIVDFLAKEPGQSRLSPQDIHVVLEETPVRVRDKVAGSVVSIKKMEEIRELEYRIRKETVRKGLVAKHTFADIAGDSPAMAQLKDLAKTYALYDSSILITGETGTGKELFAQSIHNHSARRDQPFVAVNCAAIPENLIESELFGYEKGAFTGANQKGKPGLFEEADKGTLFLDEVSEIPFAVQTKLLRIIQEQELMRIGGNSIIRVDTRIICSSNKDLPSLVRKGEFREDLYYRLCVLEINVPPLRERSDDIGAIAAVILRNLARRYNKRPEPIPPRLAQELARLPLPGNVRELGNLLERLLILADNGKLDLASLKRVRPSNLSRPPEREAAPPRRESSGLDWKQNQAAMITDALRQTGGNKAAAARLMGIDASTLWRKLKAYGIEA